MDFICFCVNNFLQASAVIPVSLTVWCKYILKPYYNISWVYFFLSAFLRNFFLCQDFWHSAVPPHLVQPCYVALGQALDLGLTSTMSWGLCELGSSSQRLFNCIQTSIDMLMCNCNYITQQNIFEALFKNIQIQIQIFKYLKYSKSTAQFRVRRSSEIINSNVVLLF